MVQRYLKRRRSQRTFPIIFLVVGLAIGLVIFSAGLAIVINRMSFLAGTVATNATILSCSYNGKGTCISATLDFRTQAGQSITVVSSQVYPLQKSGDTITVRYHAATPQDARTDADLFFPWFLVAFPVVWVTVLCVKLSRDSRVKLGIKQSQQPKKPAREAKLAVKAPVYRARELPPSSRHKARKKPKV